MKIRMTQHLAGPEYEYPVGAVIDLDDATAARYCSHGIAVPYRGDDSVEYAQSPVAQEAAAVGEPIHTGGGWWTLPNGERVRGKEDAVARWAEVQAADAGA